MHTGSELLETWIPDGGFEIVKRKLKTADGGSAVADCLVAKWPDDELTRDFPCVRQPCLHRIFAECPPDPERILALAGRYGLLTVSIPRTPATGQIVKADVLPAEQVEIWRKEALRACQKITEHLARVPFYLRASEQGFVFCPATLSAALWQRFAAEVAGIHPTRCPAPNCVRWFLRRSAARSDKRFCSNACKNRAFRRNQNAQ